VADLADQAQFHEAANLRAALAAARPDQPGKQLVVDGVVCCADCEEPIPAARLRSVSDATRCRDCQDAHERGPQC
jgi:phage/conjugal plasmid C-4 type zinc finger TraR family protein